MKQKLFKSWLLMMCLLFGVGQSWAQSTIYTSNVSFVAGSGSSDAKVKISDKEYVAMKLGTSSATGKMSFNVPSGTTKIHLHCAGWKGDGDNRKLKLSASNGTLTKSSLTLTNDNGVSSNSPFTLSSPNLAPESYYSEISISNVTTESTITLETSSKRAVVWGVNYETVADTRTEVNITAFSANSTTLVKGNTTITSVTNDQNGWTPAYTYESSNTDVATVSNTGVITAVGKGTARITASLDIVSDDATWKKGATYSKTIDITVNNPSHNYTFYSNGTAVSSGSCEEGSAITFPSNPTVEDVVFMGWAESEITGTQDAAPELVSSKNMGESDANFYAVFATASGAENTETYGWEEATVPSNWTIGGTITRTEGTTANPANSGSYYGALNSNSSVQFKNKVKVKSFSYYCVRKTNNTNTSIKIETSTNGTKWTEALSTTWGTFNSDGKTYKKIEKTWDEPVECYVRVNIVTAAGRMLDDISITYGDATYSDYCTTVSAKATATLVIADADKNVALGYNGTKGVNIAVGEPEYDGTLTVASTDDKVATVTYTGTTATIKYVGEGEAYISVTAPSTANYYAINAPQAIKVTTTDDRQVAEVTIDPATISVDNGASAEFTVTTAYDGTITAVSDKPAVATVTYADGKVTVGGKSVGTATLTISGEGNATYKPFSKTFAITVNKVVPVGIKNLRTQITSTDRNSQSNYEVKLVDAVVTYVSTGTTPTIYLEDAEAGIVIYAKNTNLAVGDKLNGVVSGKGYVYNGLTELTTIIGFEKTTGATVPCHEITLAQLAEDGMDAWESRRVVVKDLTITSAMDNRNATVEQNGVSFTLREGVSGCSDEKLSLTDNGIVSAIGYFQDYNSTTQFNIWSADDIVLAEKANAQVVFDVEVGAGTNENPVAYTIGEDNTFPTAIVKDSEGNVIEGAIVTYSTTNAAYIDVDAETGVVTLKKYASKSNKVHVTATFAGNAEYKSATADYYLTIAKGQPVISFSESAISVALDGAAGQAATVDTEKYGNLAVTYTSSNPEVASFADDNNATLTLNAEGTTTISAKTVSNDAWNQSDKVSYTLTVTAPAAGYAIVTLNACGNKVEGGAKELKVVKGRTVTLPAATTTKDEYTFRGWTATGEVAKTTTVPTLVDNNYTATENITLYPVFSMEESDGEEDYDVAWVAVESSEIQTSGYDVVIVSTGTKTRCIKTTAGNAYLVGADVTVEDGKITSTITDDSKWWAYASGTGIAFASSAGNYLNPSTVTYTEDQWTITPNGDKTYSMKSQKDNTYLYLSGNAWATTSDESLSKMQFFMEKIIPTTSSTTYYVSRTAPESLTITLNAACHDDEEGMVYGTYSSSKPFYVPENLIVSEIAIVDGALLVEEYEEGNIVPANTGVMVSALEGGNYEVEIADAEMAELAESVLGEDNCLRPSGDNGITADAMAVADANCEYFRLTMHEGTQIGFWWGADNGGAFSLAANKAYLAVPKSVGVKVASMWIDGNTTSIDAIKDVHEINGVAYNLAGQRVNANAKGIVIINGKKVLKK